MTIERQPFTIRNNGEAQRSEIDRRRFGRITRFFARVIVHVIVWDLLFNRIFLLRSRVQSTRSDRYRRLSRNFRMLAVDMGGVMIKLGQFLSARVDVLPLEITEELRGLQDEVPPVPRSEIEAVMREEWGEPLHLFAEIESEPMAAASLGQTHRAWLRTPAGDRGDAVVIKVQRPRIEQIVTTDLAALQVVARWVMKYRPIRLRADVPALMDEFAVTLREELDYRTELENAAEFAAIFENYDGIIIPRFYDIYCTRRVLVIENVEAIKITEIDQMQAVGIDTARVADRLLDVYFVQVFEASFFHADPHPGNIFVRPRPDKPRSSDEPLPYDLIFIDFGMMGRIPEETRGLLQQVLVAVTTRDTRSYIEAIERLGFFLPTADLDRIAEAHDQILAQIWGRDWLDLARPDMDEVRELSQRFKDILFEFPFQIPQNFVYLGRALGILSGMTALLNPNINPWHYVEEFGQRLAREQRLKWVGWTTLAETLSGYAQLPSQVRRILNAAERGKLKLQMAPDPQMRRQLEQLERRTRQINWSVLSGAALLSGTLFYLGGEPAIGTALLAIAGGSFVWSTLRFW